MPSKNNSKLQFGTFLRAKRMVYGWWDARGLWVRILPPKFPDVKVGAAAVIEVAPNRLDCLALADREAYVWWDGKNSDKVLELIEPLKNLSGNITEPVTFLVDEKGKEIKVR